MGKRPASSWKSCSGTPRIRPTAPTVRHGHAVCTHVDQLNAAFNVFFCGPVLSWDGEVSAVSKDAIEDAINAKSDTVIDEWDEEFDRGKVIFFKISQNRGLLSLFHWAHFPLNGQVKKIKSYKKERWRGSNIFQKVQDRRNKWSVMPGGKRVFGIRRWVCCWGLIKYNDRTVYKPQHLS